MQKINLNSNWKVWKDYDPFELVFRVPDDAKDIDLPYDAMWHEKQDQNSLNGRNTGYIDAGEYEFYKSFDVDSSLEGQKLYLFFEGIYQDSLIFINSSKVGGHAFGYSPFMVDITDYVFFDQTNDILVVVKCGTRNSRWYTGAGIYRDVYLLSGDTVFIKEQSIKITTCDLDADLASVLVEAELENISVNSRDVFVSISFDDHKESYPIFIKGLGKLRFHKRLTIRNPKAWSAENPYLYSVRIGVEDDQKIYDTNIISTGLRKLQIDSVHGLRVNGKTVKLRGGCLHHDQGILGAATYEDYEFFRISKLKEAGFNAVRSAHNHASSALLKACDTLGMYVMDELVDVWNKSKVSYDYSLRFDESWKKDIEALVEADYNHPSVVLYSTGNEIFEICTPKGIETSRMLSDYFHELDSTRFTTNGINGAFAAGDGLMKIVDDITGGTADTKSGDVNVFMGYMETSMPLIVQHDVISKILEQLDTTMDVLGYNYMTSRYIPDSKKYPSRVMVGSETYPKQISENWQTIMSVDSAIGDFTWTAWDYMGEVGRPYPQLVSESGDLSLIGVRRAMSYYRELVYGLTTTPCIAVQDPKRYGTPRQFGPWKYTDCTLNYTYEDIDAPIYIEVYGNGDSVELFQNGISLGIHECGPKTDYAAQYNTTYKPGELVVKSYKDGQLIGENKLSTAGAPKEIKTEIHEGNELVFVEITILDEDGNVVFEPVTLKLETEYEILGFGNEHSSHIPNKGFCTDTTMSYEGHALAILKKTNQDASIQVSMI